MKLLRHVIGAGLALALIVVASPARAFPACGPDTHAGGEWPMMGYDLGASRTQADEHTINRNVAPLLAPAWTFDANLATAAQRNEITGYPVVADGCVFVGSSTGFGNPGYIFAIDAYGGTLVWQRVFPNAIYASTAVANGIVYAYVSRIGSPHMVAMRETDGSILWDRTVDTQPGADAVASPIVYDGMVWAGVSGTLAETNAEDRTKFRGASVLLDALTGEELAKEYSVPDIEYDQGRGDAGGAIWSTISIDAATGYGYVGTGNPFNYTHESERTNAVLKIDVARARGGVANSKLGRVVGFYKGDVEQYLGPLAGFNGVCDQEQAQNPALFSFGLDCEHLDLDFGAQPNLIFDRVGNRYVGAGQKSGVYHVFDPNTCDGYVNDACVMHPVWKRIIGVPSPVGGIVGTPAFDGTAIYVDHSIAGYLASLDRDSGAPKWITPVADGVHWGSPTTAAFGVVYTCDLKGFLDAYDAATGAPLLHRPIGLGANTGADPTFTWGGVTVAKNMVFVSVGVGLTSAGNVTDGVSFPSMPDGFVVAFRPMKVGL